MTSVSTTTMARKDAFFSASFKIYSRPHRGEKVCTLFFPPKKGTFGRSRGRPSRPGGYQRLTLGQPWVKVRSTLGQPSVSSLAIAGRFLLILPDSSIKTEDRRTCISEMVDFPIRKRDFLVRAWFGALWEALERKNEETTCIYKIYTLVHRSNLRIFRKFRQHFW